MKEVVQGILIDNFLSKVIKTDTCWLWNGSIRTNGYGHYSNKQAHRLSYEFFISSIPKGFLVCHKCDVKLCVNPDHLFVGTQFDNMRDASTKGRMTWKENHLRTVEPERNAYGKRNGHYTHPEKELKGEDKTNAKLTNSKVLEIREEYKVLKTSTRKLAKKYNLGRTTIVHLLKRDTWKHI